MAQQKIRIKVKAFDHKVIDEATKLIIDTTEKSGAIVMGPIPLPTKIEKFTVNKSTFVFKDSREQYEMRTHKRLIDITKTQSSTIEELSNLSLPSGVDIEIKMIMEGAKEEAPAKEKETDGSESAEKPKKKPAAKKAPAKKKAAAKKKE